MYEPGTETSPSRFDSASGLEESEDQEEPASNRPDGQTAKLAYRGPDFG